VAERSLAGLLHAELRSEEIFDVADLRDPQLAALGVGRASIASSSQEHYPCTRRIAQASPR